MSIHIIFEREDIFIWRIGLKIVAFIMLKCLLRMDIFYSKAMGLILGFYIYVINYDNNPQR
jgi:hypothetical protein